MIEYSACFILMLIGLYALLMKENVVKKIMGLSIFGSGINLLLITLGFRHTFETAVIPIIGPEVSYAALVAQSVDPLPQVLVLTAIVIDVSVVALALFLGINAYKQFGTLRMEEWKE
ncbi:MAG: cation:proton antiporter subunit C [archaeon]